MKLHTESGRARSRECGLPSRTNETDIGGASANGCGRRFLSASTSSPSKTWTRTKQGGGGGGQPYVRAFALFCHELQTPNANPSSRDDKRKNKRRSHPCERCKPREQITDCTFLRRWSFAVRYIVSFRARPLARSRGKNMSRAADCVMPTCQKERHSSIDNAKLHPPVGTRTSTPAEPSRQRPAQRDLARFAIGETAPCRARTSCVTRAEQSTDMSGTFIWVASRTNHLRDGWPISDADVASRARRPTIWACHLLHVKESRH